MRRYFAQIAVDDVRPIDATRLAIDEFANVKTQNVIMVGAAFATGKLLLEAETLERVIQRLAPRGTAELNLSALRSGIDAATASDYSVAG